jgi:hypothetical protein
MTFEELEKRCAKLEDELETERMRLAGCSVAALGYFNGCHESYRSAALEDVLHLYARYKELCAQKAQLSAVTVKVAPV